MKEQLEKTFDLVKDDEHWKNPIKKILPEKGTDRELLTEAISFFTSTLPVFTDGWDVNGSTLLVEAEGYFLGPAGDQSC